MMEDLKEELAKFFHLKGERGHNEHENRWPQVGWWWRE